MEEVSIIGLTVSRRERERERERGIERERIVHSQSKIIQS